MNNENQVQDQLGNTFNADFPFVSPVVLADAKQEELGRIHAMYRRGIITATERDRKIQVLGVRADKTKL